MEKEVEAMYIGVRPSINLYKITNEQEEALQ